MPKNAEKVGKGSWRDCQRRALGFVLVVNLLETCSSTQQIGSLKNAESEHFSTKNVAQALEIRSDFAECDMTPRMRGKTDVTAGRATAARREVGRVHHLDARFSCLQQLWAESVVH